MVPKHLAVGNSTLVFALSAKGMGGYDWTKA